MSIRCPNCAGAQLRLEEDAFISYRAEETTSGDLVAETCSRSVYEQGANPRLRCRSCNEIWPIPEGVEVIWR